LKPDKAITRLLGTSVRLVVTFALLWILVTRVDFGRAIEIIGHASVPLVGAMFGAVFLTNLVMAFRWHLILAAETKSPGPGTLLKIVFVGVFFNQVLPTGVGGDAVRAWRCSRVGIALGAAIRSILLDRACGYLVLIVLYVLGLPSLLKILPDPQEREAIIAVLVIGLLGLVALGSLDRLPRPILRVRLIAPFAELSRASRRLFRDPGRCGAVLGFSIITIALSVLALKFVGDAVGSPLPLSSWLMIVPPVTLIQLVPVSVAGWGVREAALVIALGWFGVSAETALAISVLVGLCLILVGLPGGLIWLADWDIAPRRRPVAYAEAPNPRDLD